VSLLHAGPNEPEVKHRQLTAVKAG